MSFLNSTFRPRVLATCALATFTSAMAAPTTTTSTSEEDAAPASRSMRSVGTGTADTPGGESRTMQMLLDLQSSRAPLEGGERARIALNAALPTPTAPKPAAPTVPAAPTQNPFSRALEMGKPSVARELRGPTVVSAAAANQDGRPGSSEAAATLRGERYGEAGSRDAEQALREKLGGQIPVPVALMRYIRENRTTVLMCSLASLALVGWAGARATQKRR